MKKSNLLMESISDPKELSKVFGKDISFYLGIIGLFFLFSLVIMAIAPLDPGFDPNSIYSADPEELDKSTSEMIFFIVMGVILLILLAALVIVGNGFYSEWVWSGLLKKKFKMRRGFRFIGLNILLLLIIALFIAVFFMLFGTLFALILQNSQPNLISKIIAILGLALIFTIINHLFNYSSYAFIKNKKVFKSIGDGFKSFSNIKDLYKPFLIILGVAIITGTIYNFFYFMGEIYTNVIATIIFFLFTSWNKVYLTKVYNTFF